MKDKFKLYKVPVDLEIIKGPEIFKINREKLYDIVSTSGTPAFYDPDGIYPALSLYENCLSIKVSDCRYNYPQFVARYETNKFKRLEMYAEHLRLFKTSIC